MQTPGDHASALQNKTPAPVEPAAVELIDVTRRFGTFTALAGVSLTIRQGEFFSLLGPSGCGKTTLLRVIAGLDRPDGGSLRIGGRDAAGWPAHQRPVNTVFQSYALFPHHTVLGNVAFGLRMKKVPAAERDRRVIAVMELTRIADLALRKPAQLSGGQKQRVALARALVNEPEVLLLDEPLGALDLKLRKQLQLELHALQRRLGISFVHVTHDQDEALVMSDRIAVMNAGRIEQLGGPQEIYERPRTRFVAQFLGSCNLLDATVTRTDGDTLRARTALGALKVQTAGERRTAGERCTLGIRPEKVAVSPDRSRGKANEVTMRVADLVYSGSDTEYALEGSGVAIKARVLNSRPGQQDFRAGQEVSVHLPPVGLVVLQD